MITTMQTKTTGSFVATTMDMGIIRDLFETRWDASRALNIDASFRDTIIAANQKIISVRNRQQGTIAGMV
jgi:alpha-L-fucosidase 2